MVQQFVKDKIKAVHPFPYVDKCLSIADWNDPMWNTEGFNPSISQAVKNHYEGELKNLEAERMIAKPTEQDLLGAKQHAQWLYDKSEMHDTSDMLPIRFGIQSVKMCLSLSQDGEIQPIAGTKRKASKSKGDADGQSDAEEQQHEEYIAPLMCAKENDPPKRTTRSVTRLRSCNASSIVQLSGAY